MSENDKQIEFMKKIIIALFASAIFITSCQPEPTVLSPEDNPFGSLPETVVDPPDNLSTPEKIDLGRMLFWDPILSGNKDVACVSCHHPDNDYAEELETSLGVGGQGLSRSRRGGTLVKRNSMTILNTAFNGIDENGNYDPANTVSFWDNRAESLEEQALEPILSFEEMRGHAFAEELTIDSVTARLEAIPEYRQMFRAAFDTDEIDGEQIAKAIAAFERTLIANNSPFDRFARGDANALSQRELDGMNAFIDAGCDNCHSGPMFSDFELHTLGVPENPRITDFDEGAGNQKFRTGSLRNLSNTGPYMHNGVFETLEDVVEFYDDIDNGSENPNVPDSQLDPLLEDLQVPDGRRADRIVDFINSLSDPSFDKTIPSRVPSGLNPGGDIDE